MGDLKVEKSEEFALRIIGLYKFLTTEKSEYILSKQILRSGTSIGANIAESIGSESQSDFIHKLHISLKEGIETRYWLKLLYRSDYINQQQYSSLEKDCSELISILSAIIIKLKASK